MSQLSNLEELVLMVIVRLGGEAYGVSIHDQLRAAGARSSLGAIYTNLERLEQNGFVRAELGEAQASRGGRRRRVYHATARGKRALAQSEELRNRIGRLQGRPA